MSDIVTPADEPAEWVQDAAAADQNARTHARELKYPPHWLRCDFMREGSRCVKGNGHEYGVGTAAEHGAPKG